MSVRVPQGTAETLKRYVFSGPEPFSTVPSGLNHILEIHPGLTSWAKLSRPFGTLTDFFQQTVKPCPDTKHGFLCSLQSYFLADNNSLPGEGTNVGSQTYYVAGGRG